MKKGLFILITGLPGVGKTTIGRELRKLMRLKYNPTIQFNGEDLRKYFNLKGWSRKERIEISKKYTQIIKFLVDQKINVILSCVVLFNEFHKNNEKQIKNYFQIVLKSKLSRLKKIRKSLYNKKEKAWKVDLFPEYPKKPNMIIHNNHKKTPKQIAKKIMTQVLKQYEKNNS